MISLENISLQLGAGEEAPRLLHEISAGFSRGHFVAIIGPSGCGKSTLLKTIAGIAPGTVQGTIRWDGRDLAEKDFQASEFGYVPQFSIAYDELTVEESVDYSARLRVARQSSLARREMVTRLLREVGLEEFRDRRVSVLSGGQKRRLALAMELVSSPPILLCDEVTSGLDPQSEEEIVALLSKLAHEGNRLVISVTHSLKGLENYDAIVVLFRGMLAYAGQPGLLARYFSIEDPSLVYLRLNQASQESWHQSWREYGAGHLPPARVAAPPEAERPALEESGHPGFLQQFFTLLERRVRIFLRSHAQLWLQAGLVFGFPVLVSVFGLSGLPQIKNLSMGLNLNVVQQLTEAHEFLIQASKVGSLISGIVMFEVVLLTLMGANNSGREIASERPILEKEKLSGLNPLAYLGSKVVFLGVLSLIQSVWMGIFIHFSCSFPGDLGTQLLFLFLVNAAMTSICLAISSFLASAEQASLASIYLVGFQLPLSGAVLSLPDWLGTLVRPLVIAYWSWSGNLQTLRDERYYDIVGMVIQTTLSPTNLCLFVLLAHVTVGLVLAYLGCRRTCMA